MKQILILLSAVIFIFICIEVLLQTNYYVILYFNKIYNKDVPVVQTKYKSLSLVERFALQAELEQELFELLELVEFAQEWLAHICKIGKVNVLFKT